MSKRVYKGIYGPKEPYWILVAAIFFGAYLSVYVVSSLVSKVDELEDELELMRGSHTEQVLEIQQLNETLDEKFDTCIPRLSLDEMVGNLSRPYPWRG